ncbi:hypothetical protein [Lysobacter enzymogenes]|uniref:hypothetical protein n=1 Tax=Lysobacter enzymogenes TaxID=69 RepID=UPI001A956995|nr:hypothetical protein [Lysobacter enzymogenes]QQP96832.1 hypothetical protein JHW38_01895 [Lysobacter enzymogenes]
MTHSAIRYGANDLYLNDATLRELLKALAWHLPARLAESANGIDEWLVVACDRWIDGHENLPPGLRDIELDAALTSLQRAQSFARYLAWVRDRDGDGAYDEAAVRAAIDAIVARLLTPRGP